MDENTPVTTQQGDSGRWGYIIGTPKQANSIYSALIFATAEEAQQYGEWTRNDHIRVQELKDAGFYPRD